jgi:hypothetical protein
MKTTKETKIKNWYNSKNRGSWFCDIEYINKNMSEATFEDVYKNPKKVYEIINMYESDIRCDIFEELVNIYGVDYDDIYYKWLNVSTDKNITIIY